MPDIVFADVSEFQADVQAGPYLANGHTVIICRVHNSNRLDRMMPVRMNYLRTSRFEAIGWYQYLEPSVDPVRAAQAFVGTCGHLAVNEFPILDLETGSGDQTGRAQAWFDVVDKWAGFPATLYAGASFLSSNLGGSGRWAGRPIWVAAYGIDDGFPHAEPSIGHTFWQFSSKWNAPGIGQCDGSLFHGTAATLLETVRRGHLIPSPPIPPSPSPSPTPPPVKDTDLYVLACQTHGHADFIVSGEKGATINSQAELEGYTSAGVPVHILPLGNYEKICGLLGVKG